MDKELNDLLSTAEAAAQLNVSRQRVLELITEGRLPARKVGRAYVVQGKDLATLQRMSIGRPRKEKAA